MKALTLHTQSFSTIVKASVCIALSATLLTHAANLTTGKRIYPSYRGQPLSHNNVDNISLIGDPGFTYGIYIGDSPEHLEAGDITLLNTGNIQTTGVASLLIYANSGRGNISIGNDSSPISGTLLGGNAHGVHAFTSGGGSITIRSAASITVAGRATHGILAEVSKPAATSITGPINIVSSSNIAAGYIGISAKNYGIGSSTINSSGNINISGSTIDYTYGLVACIFSQDSSNNIELTASNTIEVQAGTSGGTCLHTNNYGSGKATINSTATLTARGLDSNGIECVTSNYLVPPEVEINNSGDITADRFGIVTIASSNIQGLVNISNSGDITVTQSDGAGIRIHSAATSGTVTNSGKISSPADAIQVDGDNIVVILDGGESDGLITGDVALNGTGNTLKIPGNNSQIVVGNVNLSAADSAYDVTYTDANFGLLTVNSANITDATLIINETGQPPVIGNTYTILQSAAGNTITGTFKDLPENSTIDIAGARFLINYHNGAKVTLSPLSLTVVPATFAAPTLSGGTITVNALGMNGNYYTLYSSTGLFSPAPQWAPVAGVAGRVGEDGTFTMSFAKTADATSRFYRILTSATALNGNTINTDTKYSTNVIGWYDVTLPARQRRLVANQLASPTAPTLANRFASLPTGTTAEKQEGDGWVSARFMAGAWNADFSVPRGDAVLIYNPQSTATNITFVGEAAPIAKTTRSISPGLRTFAGLAPLGQTTGDMGIRPSAGDLVEIYDDTGDFLATRYMGGAWNAGSAFLDIGKGGFITGRIVKNWYQEITVSVDSIQVEHDFGQE